MLCAVCVVCCVVMSLSLSLSFTLFLLLLNVHVHSEPHFHFTNELCLHCTTHQLMHIRTVHASYCATLPYNDAHRSGGFSFGRALKQEYFGVPAFFLRDHGLPRFDSFLHTPGASARPPRALHYISATGSSCSLLIVHTI